MNSNSLDGREGDRVPDPIIRARMRLRAQEEALRGAKAKREGSGETLGRLLEVVELLNTELDVERVLEVAARQVIDLFEAEQVFVADFAPNGKIQFRLAVNFKGASIQHPEHEVSQAVIREVAQSRQPILIQDALDDPRFAKVSSVRNLNLHSVMAAPLATGEALMGVVYADNRTVPGAFDTGRMNLLRIFADHVAIALKNAELFRDLETARANLAQSERLKTIGQLSTYLAHEIKNPLASMRLLLGELAEKKDVSESRERVLQIVLGEMDRLNAAVNQILEYARPTSLTKVPISLADIVDLSCRTVEAELTAEGIELTKSYEADIPAVLADGERLRQVLVNLTRNALQAMAGCCVKKLHLSVRRVSETAEEIRVEDCGRGVPPEQLDAVFEPFRSFRRGGTGLGLAFSRKLVREHGGHIEIRNLPEAGASVRITLPIKGS